MKIKIIILLLAFKKHFKFESSQIALFLYLIINLACAIYENQMLFFLVVVVFFVAIFLLRKLVCKYAASKRKLFHEISMALLFLIISGFQIVHKINFNHHLYLANLCYGEIIFLNIVTINHIRLFLALVHSLFFIIYEDLAIFEIFYIITFKIAILHLFEGNNKNEKKFSSFRSPFSKKITFHGDEINFLNNQEINLKIDQYLDLHYIDDMKANSQLLQNYIEQLKNIEFFLIKEFGCIPTELEYNDCFLANLHLENNPENFKNFLERCDKSDNNNLFFVGTARFFDKKLYDLILIMKTNNKFTIKIKKDICFNELLQARQLNKGYSKAISFVAHEFRTPLNCIISMMQSLDQQIDPQLSDNFIMPANISSKFLLNMVNDLLDIAQIEAETFKLMNTDFDLSFLLKDTLQIVFYQANKRGVVLKMNMENKLIKLSRYELLIKK